jgi:ABC-type antimicrobial peptide transport system permease subunit
MMGLLVRSLRGRRVRSWLAVVGVATCTLLVIVIASAYRSVRTAMASYAGQSGVDLWVAPEGVDNMIRGSYTAFIPLVDVVPLRAIPGVAAADPILQGFLPVQSLASSGPTKRLTLLTVGFRFPDGLGGPPAYVKGRLPQAFDEVVLDRAAAYRLGVGLGEAIDFFDSEFTVVGLTTGTNIMATQFLFADFDVVAGGGQTRGRASFIVVRIASGADRNGIARAIEARFPGLRAFTREEFTAANDREVAAGFIPILALVTTLGLVAAAVLVGLLILSVVDERRGDIAVLMAMGTGAPAVGRGVLVQATGLSVRGAALGITLSYGLRAALDSFLPMVPLRISVLDVVLISFLFVLTGSAAALAPVVRLSAIDPLEAFRS